MNIRLLINSLDNIEQTSSIKKYISEDLYSTPEMQPHWKRIDEGFIRGYEKYLSEVALTPDQIQNIFKQAGGGAGGEAPKDPGKLAALVDKVLPTSQAANLEKSLPEPAAGPVDGFEQKAGSAVQNLQGVDSGTKQSLMQLIKAGVQKPESQQLILAGVSAVLGGLIGKVGPIISMIPGGGPVAAAVTGAIVAGGVAVIAAKLRGEDWKSAFKGAIKPALMGGAAAVVGNLVATTVSTMMSGGGGQQTAGGGGDAQAAIADDQARMDSFQKKYPPGEGYTYQGSGDHLQVFAANGQKVFSGDIPFKSMDASQFAGLAQNGQNVAAMVNQGTSVSSDPQAGVSSRGNSGWNSMKANTNPDGTPLTLDQINQAKANLRAGNATNMADPIPSGATKGRNFEESLYNKQATLKEWLRRDAQGLSVSSVQLYPYVVEGIMDFFKGKGSKAPGAGGGVTADALNKAWVAANSPTDSEEVAKVLQSAGVPAETVSKVFTDLKLPAPTGKIEPKLDPEKSAAGQLTPATPVNIKDILDQILTLSPTDQQQVLAYLKK